MYFFIRTLSLQPSLLVVITFLPIPYTTPLVGLRPPEEYGVLVKTNENTWTIVCHTEDNLKGVVVKESNLCYGHKFRLGTYVRLRPHTHKPPPPHPYLPRGPSSRHPKPVLPLDESWVKVSDTSEVNRLLNL